MSSWRIRYSLLDRSRRGFAGRRDRSGPEEGSWDVTTESEFLFLYPGALEGRRSSVSDWSSSGLGLGLELGFGVGFDLEGWWDCARDDWEEEIPFAFPEVVCEVAVVAEVVGAAPLWWWV